MTPDPLPSDIERKLMNKRTHYCARCLEPIKHGIVCERQGRGTLVVAHCHGHRVVTLVLDINVEDSPRIWHFLHDEGEPYEGAGARRKRELQAEVDRLRGKP